MNTENKLEHIDDLVSAFNVSCNNCKIFFREQQIKRCSRCKLARYCSVECQKNNWNSHKPLCDLIIKEIDGDSNNLKEKSVEKNFENYDQ